MGTERFVEPAACAAGPAIEHSGSTSGLPERRPGVVRDQHDVDHAGRAWGRCVAWNAGRPLRRRRCRLVDWLAKRYQ